MNEQKNQLKKDHVTFTSTEMHFRLNFDYNYYSF